jgi:hypothetical protein
MPVQFFVAALLGWLQREQHEIILYLREENRVLRRSCVISVCG